MADLYCDSAGSNTAPYETWAKAATVLDAVVAYHRTNGSEDNMLYLRNGQAYGAVSEDNLGNNDLEVRPESLTGTRPSIAGFVLSDALGEATGRGTLNTLTFTGNVLSDWAYLYEVKYCHFTGGSTLTMAYGTMEISYCLLIGSGSGTAITLSAGSAAINIKHTTVYDYAIGLDNSTGVAPSVTSSIFMNCDKVNDDATGIFTSDYSCYYGYVSLDPSMTWGDDDIFVDPDFVDTTDFLLPDDSPCAHAGHPSEGAAPQPYGGLGLPDMGRWGNTSSGAGLPAWAIGIGYGYDYGNHYGGYVANEYIQFKPDQSNSAFAIVINGFESGWIDLTGTTVNTIFTSTEPDNTAAATSIAHLFNETSNQHEFYMNGVRKARITSAGGQVG